MENSYISFAQQTCTDRAGGSTDCLCNLINQVRLFNEHPTGKGVKTERLHAMMGDGGIHQCSYAQNCVQICPKNIPLTTSISIVYGQAMKQTLKDLFQNPETAEEGEVGHRKPSG